MSLIRELYKDLTAALPAGIQVPILPDVIEVYPRMFTFVFPTLEAGLSFHILI